MVDPTTLNPAEQVNQYTAFVLTPSCVRCGHVGLSLRKDGHYRCDGCTRIVTLVEYAPTVMNRQPSRLVRTQGAR